MRKPFLPLLFLLASAVAGQSLFSGATESKWTVTKSGSGAGTITVLTSGNGVRAEWQQAASAAPIVFLTGQGKVWLRQPGGDVDFATISASTTAYDTVPALLLVSGRPATHKYRGATASYTYDHKGPLKIEIKTAGSSYSLKRTSLKGSSADASNFEVRPRKGAASKLARLSGNLLGPSDTNVSATAGGRGVSGKGMKLADGGNYDALLALETRDEKWKKDLHAVLAEFQKEGKVGKGREK